MRQISTENLELIAKGVTAKVYALNDDLVLKVFRDVVPEKDIEQEYAAVRLVSALGISTPAAREMVKCKEGTGIVYDRVHGQTLAEEIKEKGTSYFEYGKKYGETVYSLHSKKVKAAAIPEALPLMEGMFQNTYGFISEAEVKKLITCMRKVPEADCLLHGDISPVNIMVENGKLVVIDVPTIMKGHPVFDLLQPYAYCRMTTELYERYLSLSEEEKNTDAGRFMARFGARYLGKDAADQVWAGFLRGYFGDETKIPVKDIECVLCFYNAIKLMGSVCMAGKFSEDTVRFLVEEGRNKMRELAPFFDECASRALEIGLYLHD